MDENKIIITVYGADNNSYLSNLFILKISTQFKILKPFKIKKHLFL